MALIQIQYDFFEEKPDEFAVYRLQIAAIDETVGKVRRKLFAENGALKKRVVELEESNNELKRRVTEIEARLAIIERFICREKTS